MTIPQKHESAKLTYKPEEASPLLGIGRNTVYELLRSGRLRSIRIGRKIIIPASAINEFLSKKEDKC